MNLDRILAKVEGGLESRNRALLWLKQAQATGGWREYGIRAAQRPPAFLNWNCDEEAHLMYILANHLNCTVLSDAASLQTSASWAAIYIIEISDPGRAPSPQASERWHRQLIRLLEDTLILEAVVDRIAQVYFGGEQVLFRDALADLKKVSTDVRDLVAIANLLLESTKLATINEGEIKATIASGIDERFNLITQTARATMLAGRGQLLAALDVINAVIIKHDPNHTVPQSC